MEEDSLPWNYQRILAVGRAQVERGFAHLKTWRILVELRTEPARAPACASCSINR
ncbi:hypothetical protein [Streptomyces globisporus]|uniref:hypothetical protein n=1 Tax=Streptomyces globisporus TaxID=1908 RepID=UPI0036C2E0D0